MPEILIRAVATGITAFAATNLDDILVLMLFFSQIDRTFRRHHIITGQYLGFAVLLLISLPGFFGGLLIPRPWIGLLGLVPIAIGISSFFQQEDDEPVQTVSQSSRSVFAQFLNPQTYQVAVVTIANGGDNIGIYLPLFASSTWLELIVILVVFLIMIAIWCAIAQYLATHRLIARPLMNYGHRIIPFVLIALGFYILWENKTHTFLSLLKAQT
ncbi:cadmium resistance transporter [Leptolyngbya boryana CZ1]|uniref:Cadmium resistance transporter n=1 Tax=Leptolyngbya boryana CZ1 TaxID=3060204 RepID=A0AA96WYY5_LEPBY|nr:cadmium resistance transporter [Leptolyngbya boryana]WNZ48481.1 cadmium resistance transporter [Leptolyngbya boryana CZ1]